MQKVKSSQYLQKAKPLLKELLCQAQKEYSYVSILAVDARAYTYQVTAAMMSMGEDALQSSRGFVIRAYDGQAYGEYSFNDISKEGIGEILLQLRRVVELKKCEGIPSQSQYGMLADELCVFAKSTECDIDPAKMGDEAILHALTALKDQCMAYDERVINSGAVFRYQKYSKLFLSPHRDMEQNVMWSNGTLQIIVQKERQIKYSFEGFSKLGGAELLDSMGEAVGCIGKKAVDLLSAEPMIPGEYDCICTPEVTGMIAHEAFGHGVEMDMFVKDRALAASCVGDYVASPMLTMHDGASLQGWPETASYFFDDEGTLSTDTIVIQDGILKSGISDAQSAMHLGTAPTGNGRRESYRHKAYTRMTNTWFEPGKDRLEDMIASISYGFMLEDASSGMEDPKNWGIQMMVNIAREIRDGRFTGRIFSPVVLTGYVPDLLKSITMMSDKASLCGSGMCGKGYKEWVKVSDGGPYIKARIRLG